MAGAVRVERERHGGGQAHESDQEADHGHVNMASEIGVDELVEARLLGHLAAARRVALSRIRVITRGPPSRSRVATKTLAQIEGWPAPSASSASATAAVKPTSPIRKLTTAT